MLREIRLLGKLGRLYGRRHSLHIESPGEAVRALCGLIPGFMQSLYHSEDQGIGYRVVVGRDPEGLDEDQVQMGLNDREDLVIITPIISGAGNFGKILLGGALLAASFFMPASIGFLGMALSSTTVGLLGAGLILGGVSQMISPQPKTPKEGEKRDSFLVSRSAEPGRQGNPMPLGYGTTWITGMAVISGYVTTIDMLS